MSRERSTPRAPVHALASTLRAAGIRSWETGEALSCQLGDAEASLTSDRPGVEMTAQCRLADLLRALPNAIPVRPQESIALAPSPQLPIEVRCIGARSIESHLAARDFTIHAIARDPLDGSLVDPLRGVRHLEERTLHPTPRGSGDQARQRALRAARLAAQGYTLSPGLHEQLTRHPEAFVPQGRQCARELAALLLASDAQRGIDVLESTGLLRRWLGSGRRPASDRMNALPKKLPLRLAALIGPGATRIARKLGFSRSTLASIERLHRNHPVDLRLDAHRHSKRRRLARALPPGDLADLVCLREAELCGLPESEATAIREKVRSVREAIECARSEVRTPAPRLALDGRDVMAVLGCPPGPEVGRTLGWLREVVERDPDQNSPERLRDLLAKRSAGANTETSSGEPSSGESG